MTKDKDDRKRQHLRLVVDNADKRNARSSADIEEFIPLEELCARRNILRGDFYRALESWQAKAYEVLERYLERKGWSYGLDPHHGHVMVLPASVICPSVESPGATDQDETLLYISDDATGHGLCMTLEMVLPFYSEDDSLMEDALLYAPIFQYGALFLEENRQDGFLDLIYRVGFPLYPPALTDRLLDRFFAVVVFELSETLRSLTEYPEG